MANILKLLPNSVFKELQNEAIVSVVLSLQKNNKVVTGRTAKSVDAKTVFSSSISVADINVFGGGGFPFITQNKPPNTNLPVRKVGSGFELVPELKSWKAAVGFGGSDFLLARSIAKNPRAAVDIVSPAEEIFLKRTKGILPAALAKLIGTELKNNFEKDKKI